MTPEYGELRRAAEKASPSPWTVRPYVIGTTVFGGTVEDVSGGIVTWGGSEGLDPPCTTEDAAYIAAANPDVILALLDERERLLTALEACSHDLWAEWGEEGPQADMGEVLALLAQDRPAPTWAKATP